MKILRPDSRAEAAALAETPGVVLAAGATALQVLWQAGAPRPAALADLSRLGLSGITLGADGLEIGAATPLAALEAEPRLAQAWPLLARALPDVGAPAVRRLGSLGGQLGWGAGCLLPALIALGAEVVTWRTGGETRQPVEDWLAAPQGLIVSIFIAPQTPGAPWCWRKVGRRAGFSPALVTVAGVYGAAPRLAAGGGAVPPQRLRAAEAAVPEGAEAVRAAVAARLSAPDCPMQTGAYKVRVAALALADGGMPPRPPGAARASGGLAADGSAARPELTATLAGRGGYATDHRAPKMLVGRILRAGRPHARIVEIDVRAAEALPGVTVVTHRDIQGQNSFGILWPDQPALCHDVVRHIGDPVAAVAAPDAAAAEQARAAIKVTYADLPAVTAPAAALAPEAPPLHPKGNLAAGFAHAEGNLDAAFAAAAHVVQGRYVTPRQMHSFLETEGGWAAEAAGLLTVAVGAQAGPRDQAQLARILGRPAATIRVISGPTGGAFGGKDELTVQPVLALLALKAGQPVRLHLSRADSVCAGIKRTPMQIEMRTACDAKGRLVAQKVDVLADCGAYASLSPAVLETALEAAIGPYRVPAIQTEGRLAYTNNGTCGAFRGFGANQMAHAVECQMDRLAARVGLSPVEIRRRNLRLPGAPAYLGHKVAGSERLAEMLEAAAGSALWAPPEVSAGQVAATGMALAYQGNGLGSLPADAGRGRLRLAADGAIEIAAGLSELGQGLAPALRAAVARHLGCASEDVRAVTGDTLRAPDAGSTSASRGTFVAWTVARDAAPRFARQIRAAAAKLTGAPAEAVQIAPGGVGGLSFAALAEALGPEARPEVETGFAFPKTVSTGGNARFVHCFGATLARVAVDRITGGVTVSALEMHTAAGPVLDAAAYLGQIEGGLVQGLGMTLTEDFPMPGARGVHANLDGYLVPTLRDVPPIAVTALEDLDPGDPWGPRGVGELGIAAVAGAIANGLGAATGWWPERLPVDPAAVLDALERRG